MSKAGKVFFGFSFFSFLLLCAARFVYGGWHPALWVPFVLTFVLFLAGIAKDHRAIIAFFTMRTAKHGMNMGALILTMFAALACVNFLAARYDKKFDWSSDRINSLSDQSIMAARALKQDTELVLLYRAEGTDENIQRAIRDLVDMYRNVSPKIKYTAYNALQRPDLAQKYEFTQGAYAFYAVQGERKLKIDPPSEECVTRALVKMGREKKKNIYFTRGHGELQLDAPGETGLSALKDELSATYEVKSLALFEVKDQIPADADVIAVIGPKQQFLDSELKALREYARRGGRLLLALDPGTRHNLALLTKGLGIEFSNDFVLDLRSQALKSAPSLVLGTDFARDSEITKAFVPGSAITLFELASSLKPAPNPPEGLTVVELVKTDNGTANFQELKEKVEYKPNGPHIIAMSAKGVMQAIVFGDSDFLGNRLIHNNLNRDLAVNSVAWLASDNDLISIRPKEPKATPLNLTGQSYGFLVLALLLISAGLFGSSFAVWWRRRTA